MSHSILLVDDDVEFATLLSLEIQSLGYEVFMLNSSEGLEENISSNNIELVLLDVMLGDERGIDVIPRIQKVNASLPILMMSSRDDTQIVVNAMKAGAGNYIVKTDNGQVFKEKIAEVFEFKKKKETQKSLIQNFGDQLVVGQSPATHRLVQEVSKVSVSDATVFLRGESGTGKSLIAEMIHSHSSRSKKPFVTINCSAIPENLIESELFGHVKGSFTGASQDKQGKFEYANGGTVFLDEIGELNPDVQVKILRVLQSHEFERVGGLNTIKANVRIVAATNRNIEKAIQEKNFREDLFYRLNVLPIYVPSLRERKEDISYLVEHFIEIYSRKMNKNFSPLSENIMKHLEEYEWPGNIRELQNVVERAVILGHAPNFKISDFVIQTKPLEADYSRQSVVTPQISSVQDLEYRSLVKAIEESHGNMTKAAKILGICRDTLYRRLKKYGIQTKTQKGVEA